MPLAFVGKQGFRWGGIGGKEVFFDGVYVSVGTKPAGSTWSKNPVPRTDKAQTGEGFPVSCNETAEYQCSTGGGATSSTGGKLEILDSLKLPADLPAGDYVLGWRHDQEESNQVWASCSDVTITSAGVTL